MLTWRMQQQLSIHTPAFQFMLAALVGVALGGASILLTPELVLGGLAVVVGLLVALKRPELLILLVLVFSSTIIEEATVPVFRMVVMSLYITEIFLIIGAVWVIMRMLVEDDFKFVTTPLDLMLFTFFAIVLVSAGWGVYGGEDLSYAISEIRIVLYYLMFFAVTNLVRSEAQLKALLFGFFGLATFVATAMFLQFVVGDSVQILPGRVERLITTGSVHNDITRIVSVGEGLVLAAFITMMTISFIRPFSFRATFTFLASCWTGLAVLITFNRNFWVAVLLAMVMLFLLIKGRQKAMMIGWLIGGVVLITIIMLFVFALPGGRAQTLVLASAERMFSLVDDDNYETEASTFKWRNFEYQYALATVIENPFIGIGMGSRYRPTLEGIDGYRFNGQRYIHNAHLWIMMKTGVIGYLLFMGVGLGFIGRGLWYWSRIESTFFKGTVLGFALTYIGVIVGSIVNPMFMQWYWTPIFGIMMGTNEVILKNYVPRKNESE